MNRSSGQGTSRRRRVLAGGLITFALTTLTVLGYTSGGSFASNGYYYCPGGGDGGGYYGYCPPTTTQPTRLIVIKDVVNDHGGTANAANFTMTINGITAGGGNSFPGEESPGTTKTVTPGAYTVTETGPAGYDATFSSECSGTIAAGQTKTCTVTNDDQPAHLIVIKHVINNDTGSATAANFTMTINGVTVPGGSSFPGAEAGTNKIVFPGSYSVSESGPSGYFTTFSADCTGSIALGQTKTCTVTNNDIGPRRTPGYWKNHEAATTPMLPVTLGPYSVNTFAQALAIFDSMNCGSSQPSTAVDCLAGQLLAAKLNVANGNNPCIQPTINKADSFLSGGTVTAGGVTATGVTYTGPGTYTLTSAQRSVALKLALALDKYNNNKKGCSNP